MLFDFLYELRDAATPFMATSAKLGELQYERVLRGWQPILPNADTKTSTIAQLSGMKKTTEFVFVT